MLSVGFTQRELAPDRLKKSIHGSPQRLVEALVTSSAVRGETRLDAGHMCTSTVVYIHIHTYIYIYYCSKVWGHADNLVFSMKTHTFIDQINCKMYVKYSQDIEEVINKDFYCKY